MWLTWVVVLHPYTQFEIRRPWHTTTLNSLLDHLVDIRKCLISQSSIVVFNVPLDTL